MHEVGHAVNFHQLRIQATDDASHVLIKEFLNVAGNKRLTAFGRENQMAVTAVEGLRHEINSAAGDLSGRMNFDQGFPGLKVWALCVWAFSPCCWIYSASPIVPIKIYSTSIEIVSTESRRG